MIQSNEQFVTSALRRRGHVCTILIGLALVIQHISIFTSTSEVPLHWGADGEADAYGSPWLTLIVWVVLAACVALCKFVAAHVDVQYWNRPSKVQPGDLDRWYAHSMSVLYNVNLMISILTLGIAVLYALHAYWLMFPFIIIAAIVIIAYSIYANFNWKRAS